ncbi:PEPxxWA-CTERM sorting domain-containing protein [Glacieibacterium frigidum]|nr:PEPxxWA-CTERM sorting domain-containing protein [Glacieibacterium frigidum]
MRFSTFALLGAAALAPLSAAHAAPRVATGSLNGVDWRAESRIIGQTSTATVVGGGNPIYLGTAAQYRGTVGLLMDYGAGGAFVCSGSLSANGTSIITAAHCVSDGTSARPNSVTAFFYNPAQGDAAETPIYSIGSPGVTAVDVGFIHVNPLYTGEVIDQNDIAVLKLTAPAPSFAVGYDLYTGNDLTGLGFNVAGYGGRSDVGGALGQNLGTGRLRQGDNRYDFAFGDDDFGGFFTDVVDGTNFFGTADIEFSYVSDFDNGLAANDASCRLATLGLGVAASDKYCNTGVGALEVNIAGGDSGGPGFIDGKLASVNSYGLSFGATFGDFNPGLNSSWGEFSGYAPIFASLAFVQGAIPEPGTWVMMIGGFGLVGAASRRARRAALTA